LTTPDFSPEAVSDPTPGKRQPAVIKAIIKILEDHANQEDHIANVAEDILEVVEEHLNSKFKIAVVGQILVDGAEKPRIVVLGPFGAQGRLEDQESWDKAAAKHTTSRTEGGKLAFRSTGGSRGRFLLAPVFQTAAKAWKFFPDHPKVMEVVEREFQTIRGADPANLAGPTCLCGFRNAVCHRHPKGRV
jgi:hypothetical protein